MIMFEIGQAYHATGCVNPMDRRFVVAIGREGSHVQFAFVDDLASANVRPLSGFDREFLKVEDKSGTQYNVSAAVPVSMAESAEVLAILNRRS